MSTPESATRRPSEHAIAVWLLVCCAMVFIMVVLGGATRLTHSGLSMVEWQPLTGILPPLSEAEWRETFAKYQQFPEFQKLNRHMDLDGFKSIFWFEFTHRLWGRAIGIVFLLPLVYFALRGAISRSLAPKLVVAFILGGLQGLLGWYMVASGLVDRPDVSQYRLTAHLAAAFLIYGYMLWLALELLDPAPGAVTEPARRPLRCLALALMTLFAITVLSGGLVAGTDAGFAYNTFPLMDGRLVPDGLWDMTPPFANVFENTIMVQFNHRVLATGTVLLVLVLWWRSKSAALPRRAQRAADSVLVAAVVQFGLGVATLISVVATPLAATHQAVAMVLFSALVWLVFELRPNTAA